MTALDSSLTNSFLFIYLFIYLSAIGEEIVFLYEWYRQLEANLILISK